MQDLHIELLETKHLEEYGSWLDHRATTNLLLKQSNYQDLDSPETQAWAGSIAGEVVAVALLYLDEARHGHLDFAVKPSERRHGIGAEMMTQVLADPVVKDLINIQVVVEPENIAGQKIARKTGFVLTGSNPEGFLVFTRR